MKGRESSYRVTLAGILALVACAGIPKGPQASTVDQVKELEVPFPVKAPLTTEDARQIAALVRGMLQTHEQVGFVEPISCAGGSCGSGIDERAEAWVLSEGSDMADVILLCKRSGRWIASRPTDGMASPDCPARANLPNTAPQSDGRGRKAR
jgi:hypothetical protein